MFNATRFHLLFLVLAATLLALVTCSAPEPTATSIPPTDTPVPPTDTPVPPTAVAQAVTEGIEVTFDGNECIVSGPSMVPVGEYPFVLKELGEPSQALYVSRLLDGHTYQDVLDLQSEPGVYYPKPSWVRLAEKRYEWNESKGAKDYTFSLIEEGEYEIYIAGHNPPTLWFCAPLKVIEAPSE